MSRGAGCWRLAGWCLAIAGLGLPAAVIVALWGGAAAAAGMSVIGGIAVAALATARRSCGLRLRGLSGRCGLRSPGRSS
jgi:hypothetical protein